MKIILLIIMLIITSSAHQMGDKREPSDITIIKYSWNEYRPDWDKDLYRNPNQAAKDERDQLEKNRRPVNRTDRNNIPSVIPETKQDQTSQTTKGFQYRVTVKNTGNKTIKIIEWDYVFTDSNGQQEVERHEFQSEKKIKPGETKELVSFSVSPPTRVVSASQADDVDARRPSNERVIINRIEYTDGSAWQRP